MSVAVVLGSAFNEPSLGGRELQPVPVDTAAGQVTLYHLPERRDAWVVFRHGAPHRWLPNQIPWRAQALALAEVGCGALLLTSSVGVLDPELPLYRPMLIRDLLMPDNRLPDGSACTVWTEPTEGQGHLVVVNGLFDRVLSDRLAGWPEVSFKGPPPRVIFAYVGGPRTKTAAENRWWANQGAQVNSMSVGPEVVMANELQIPVAGLVIGHKYSVPGGRDALDHASIEQSLVAARAAVEAAALRFLREAEPVPFRNRLHRL